MNQVRAESASRNIGIASNPAAHAERLDFARSQGLLAQAAADPVDADGQLARAIAQALQAPADRVADVADAGINLDEQVADMASATLQYQALTESLNRHFGLMRLAISGRN
jgi:flagellar basal body rod protein FlgB